jgi:NADH-quinone oxidoreductase subunit B
VASLRSAQEKRSAPLPPCAFCLKTDSGLAEGGGGRTVPPKTSFYMSNPAATEVGYDSKLEGEIIVTRADAVVNWFRSNSVWPMPMGTACCAIELMAAGGSRFDIARFGMEVMRFSPRQSDCMIVAGTINKKLELAVKTLYDQMPEPKWVIAMGNCAISGGPFVYPNQYSVVEGVDKLFPVDVYVPGCPPRPEALIEGILELEKKLTGKRRFPEVKIP